MFDLDKWQEIFATIQKNKLRTFLTALGVGWGIFMLVVLLGVGKGMENGVRREFGNQAINSIWIWGGKTSMPYKGLNAGRTIQMTEQDFEVVQREAEGIEFMTKRNSLSGAFTVNYKDKNGAFRVLASDRNYFRINGEILREGRFINDLDNIEKRKVAFIGERVKNVLFGDSTAIADAIGKYIDIKGVYFQVVGVFNLEGGNGRREERLYIPYTTYQVVYEPTQKLDLVGMTTQKDVSASELEAQLREILARELKFDPADNQAIDLENNEEDYKQFQGLFTGIAAIVWFVGLGTLAAGIVGVSSIMLIIVKERTKEIGVRKALGATPFSIVSLILQESIFITSFAGYIGMLFGIGVLEILRTLVEQIEASGGEAPYFSRPEMNLGAAVAAIIVLVVAGALAGFFPAMRAANVKPIEALRAD